MKFYYNPGLNVCADEQWLVEYLHCENCFALYNDEEIRDELHSRREVCGWFECEVSNTIADAMFQAGSF